MDDVDKHILQQLSSFEDLIEVKIEDYVTGIKSIVASPTGRRCFNTIINALIMPGNRIEDLILRHFCSCS